MKKIISGIIGTSIIANTLVPISVNAKVIEPEIVKTETWTTSYYIDDDMDTLYPYIDCQADIYNDGTVKVYFWNTHEWDGFATVKHTVTMVESLPYPNNSMEYMFKNHLSYIDGYRECYATDYSIWDNIDLSYYPEEYSYKFNFDPNNYGSPCYSSVYYYCYTSSNYSNERIVNTWDEYIALPNLSTTRKYELNFTPTVEITSTYNFRIFGHDITITPEILSGNIIAEPVLTDTEKIIQELEKENAELKAQNEKLLNTLNSQGNRAYGDMNNDGITDARDASILLTYYAKTSVGWVGTFDEFVSTYTN